MAQGSLLITLETARTALPVVGQVIVSQTINGNVVFETVLQTDASGVVPVVTLEAPDASLSLNPSNTQTPYGAYDVRVEAEGFAPVEILGVQIYDGVESYLPINLVPAFSSAEDADSARSSQQLRYTVPPPAIRSASASGPAPLVFCENESRVLSSVFIPQYITVHLGRPQNSAANETVSFPYYIKNVCSSEIYPTWPENAIRANIYAQISLALNRVFTEWYPSKGYNFNITNSTQYDQYYVSGRNIFTNISRIVDEIFNTYLRRVGDFAPYYAEYCNGTTVTCRGLSQWGTVSLANSGRTPIQILRYYYGSNFELVTTNDVRSIPSSYPGSPLRQGDSGNNVRIIQRWLARIARNYPAIGNVSVDGVFGAATRSAVITFQRIFNLTQDGVVGKATWYKISYIYVAVKKLAELGSESEPYPDGGSTPSTPSGSNSLQQGARGPEVAAIQYFLTYLAQTFYPTIPELVPDGIFGAQTRSAVVAFQQLFGLTVDGLVGRATWAALLDAFEEAYDDNNPGSFFGAYPGIVLRQGNVGLRVQQMQYYLLYLSYSYSAIPRIEADGNFGPATAQAVRAFQGLFGLTQDGVVGINTWTQLYSVYAQVNAGLLEAEQTPGYPGYQLRLGSSGAAVLALQRYLWEISRRNSGIQPVPLDGEFGQKTREAVQDFQRQNGLAVTGRVDEALWLLIYAAYIETLRTHNNECRWVNVAYPGQPITLGQTSVYVQVALYYYSLIAQYDLLLPPVDLEDTYNLTARAAIEEFQRTRGLEVTGNINAETWQLLYQQYVAAYRATYPACADLIGRELPFQQLLPGSRGSNVEQLQVWINALAQYYCELIPQTANGVYDETTESNVLLLQSIFRLEETGIVNAATWRAIRDAYDTLTQSNQNGVEATGDALGVRYSNRRLELTDGIDCVGNCGYQTHEDDPAYYCQKTEE